MRTAFVASTSRRGDCLLKIVDSRHVPGANMLVLVTQQARQSLKEALKTGANPAILARAERQRLWTEFDRLLKSLFELHKAGLMHRNISLDSLYLSADEDGPEFKIGDYTWTIYLHNLSAYLKSATGTRTRDDDAGIYRAPELRSQAAAGESFATDLYAMGVVMAALVSQDARAAILKGEDREILELIESDKTLSDLEKFFFASMLAQEPSARFENALRASESALQILGRYASENQSRVANRLTVDFNLNTTTESGKRNIEGLAKWGDPDGIIPRLDEFLKEDLTGAEVFLAGMKRSGDTEVPRLYIRGRRGHHYFLEPWWDRKQGKYDYDVGSLKALTFDPPWVSETPIAILEGGVSLRRGPWERPQHSWAPTFALAKKRQTSDGPADDAELFRRNLWILHDAEELLLAKQVVPVRVTGRRSDPATNSLVLSVTSRPDASNPQFPHVKPDTLEKWIESRVKNQELSAYLTADPTFEKRPDERSRVGIIPGLKAGELELDMGERGVPPAGVDLWLKPSAIGPALKDLRKKKTALHEAQVDDYLVQVLSKPEQNTLFLDARPSDEIWDRVLNTRPLFVIQGPPGTGKTFTATRVITTALRQGTYTRILVVSQAHDPLDHLKRSVQEALEHEDFETAPTVVRLAQREDAEWGGTVTTDRDLSTLAKSILQAASSWQAPRAELEQIAAEWRDLASEELENPSAAWTKLVLRSANVVFTTAMSRAIPTLADHPPFDLVVVEEAAKAYPTELLAALRRGRNWLLIGDQMQLPPYRHEEMEAAAITILESGPEYADLDEAERAVARDNLKRDIRFFGSLHEKMRTSPYPFMPAGGAKPVDTLTTQRRLPPELSKLIGQVFYKQNFVHATQHRDPIIREPVPFAKDRLIWLNTPSRKETDEFRERRQPGGAILNPSEANLIVRLLMQAKLASKSIAVLSPYSAQVSHLRNLLRSAAIPGLPEDIVHTVDSFQGREADLVILSMVRNNLAENASGALGFLNSKERMNVLLSRARNQLVIVGCMEMFNEFKDPELDFWREVVAFIKTNGRVLTPQTAGLR